jgi:NAD(P)-dependent dehydrogenase (short-subunit alcohol dehydrogenase family)
VEVEGADPADHDPVIAGEVLLLEVAVEVGHCAVQEARACHRCRRPGHGAGGLGVAIQVGHLDSGQVARLAQRVGREHGHLDVLVNDIWRAEALKGPPSAWNTPTWEHNLDVGLRILRLGVETHLITSHHLLPLLVARPGGRAHAGLAPLRDDAGRRTRWNQRSVTAAEVAREYGFTDVDGTQPDSWAEID